MKKIFKITNKGAKITIIVAGSIIVLIALVAIFISPITKHYVETHDKELVGRKIRIDKLKINIFTGTLKINNLTLYEKNDKDTFVRFDTLDTQVSLHKLLGEKVDVQHIYLSGFSATILQKNDWFNFNDIIEHFTKKKPDEKKDTTPSNWKVVLNDIQIKKSRIIYKDLAIGSKFSLKDLALNVPIIDLSTIKSNVDVGLNFVTGGSLRTKINWNPLKNYFLIDVNLKNFSTAIVLPYLQETMNVSSLSGRLNTNIKIKGQTKHIMNLNVFGNVSLNDFLIKDNKSKNIVSFDRLYCDINKIDLNKNQYLFNQLTINGIVSSYEMYKNATNNFTYLMKPSKPSKTSSKSIKKGKEKPMIVKVKDVKINVKTFNIKDLTLIEPFDYNIKDINITSKDFDLNGKNKIDVVANVGKGDLKVNYEGTLNSISNMNLIVKMKNIQMKDFSPYVKNMFSCPLTSGTLALKSQTKITNNNLKGINKIDLFDPEVGKKDRKLKTEYQKIPLKLGIYVITDKDKKAMLDLPVSGNINSPEFSYKKLIIKTLCNLLVKVAEAPFNMLGKALGISGDGLQSMDLTSYQRDFSSEQYAKLMLLAKIAKSKPQMVICFEQQIEYDKAIKDISMNELRKHFYLSSHPEIDKTKIDLLNKEDLKNVDEKSDECKAFIDNELKAKNLSTSGSVEEKAVRLYGQGAQEKLISYCQSRNEKITSYFTTKEGLSANRLKITTMTIDQMKNANKTQYKISLSVKGDENQ